MLRAERSDVERRYEAEIGPLEIAQVLPRSDGGGSVEVAKIRAAADAAKSLETIEDELKRLAEEPLSAWSETDAEFVRDSARTHRSTLALLSDVEPMPSAASVVDLHALDTSGNPSGNTLLLLGLSRLARLTALEALRRGDVEAAVPPTRGLLASAAYLERSPHRLYRMLGMVLEVSGTLVLRAGIDRFDAPQLRHIASTFDPLRSLPDEGKASQAESLAFYHAGLDRITLPFLPDDFARVLWLRCELDFAPVSRMNYIDANGFRDAMQRGSAPAHAVCRKFVGGRVEGLVREATMHRVRRLALLAIALRTGEPSPSSLTNRELWSLTFFDQRLRSTVDEHGAAIITDPGLRELPITVGLGGRMRIALEELATWRVELPTGRIEPDFALEGAGSGTSF